MGDETFQVVDAVASTFYVDMPSGLSNQEEDEDVKYVAAVHAQKYR